MSGEVGHDADDACTSAEGFADAFGGSACEDGDDDAIVDEALEIARDVGEGLGFDGEEELCVFGEVFEGGWGAVEDAYAEGADDGALLFVGVGDGDFVGGDDAGEDGSGEERAGHFAAADDGQSDGMWIGHGGALRRLCVDHCSGRGLGAGGWNGGSGG